jgi:hypothetical protein
MSALRRLVISLRRIFCFLFREEHFLPCGGRLPFEESLSVAAQKVTKEAA